VRDPNQGNFNQQTVSGNKAQYPEYCRENIAVS
jgi:hypothetical protein